jgi:murein DD-endopeptidase MepM/ murein hydrolase activator NlpD
MTVRHRRRATLALLTAASLVGGVLPLLTATPAEAAAADTIAGTGAAKTDGTSLNMRRVPSAAGEPAGSVANGGTVWIMCQAVGEPIAGTVRTTTVWDRLANGTYVSDAYVVRDAFPIPVCLAAPIVPGDWQLPVPARMVSGFRTVQRPAHDGVDLGAVRNTAVRAAAAGTVIRVVCNVSAGTCDVDGNSALRGCGWYAEVRHAGDIVTRYCHLVRRPDVQVGQVVAKGQLLGYVGTSGSSSGPHLHFEVHLNAPPATHANAISPIAFLRARGLLIR